MQSEQLRHMQRASLFLIAILMFTLCACGQANAGKYGFVDRPSGAITIVGAGTFTGNAACLSNEQMIGGGYGLPTPQSILVTKGFDPTVIASYPSAPNQWTVLVNNPASAGTVNDGQTFYVYVDCLTSSSPNVGMTQAHANGQVPPPPANSVVSVTAMCPSGTLTSGGYNISGSVEPYLNNSGVAASMPATGGQGWTTTVINQGGLQGTPLLVTAYALCATQQFMAASPVSQAITWPSQSSSNGSGSASCGTNQIATGGGFSVLASGEVVTGQILLEGVKPNFSGWNIQANSLAAQPGEPNSILAWAVCINKPS